MDNQIQAFGTLKISVSTYFLPPDDIDALEHLRSILNSHSIHNVANKPEEDQYKLNLLNCSNQVISELNMHDIDVEWDIIYTEN